MRAILYTCGCVLVLIASLAMAFLPRLSAGLFWFGLIGAVLSGLIALGWVVQSATADPAWPRLKTGYALMLGGLAGLLTGLGSGHWLELGWGALVLAAGGAFLFPPGRSGRRSSRRLPGPVRPPVSRRGEL